MSILGSQKLLLIVPHFKVFIRDQATLIRPYFSSMTVLMPIPFFSTLALKLPFVNRNFDFLKSAVESRNELTQGCRMVSPSFFTLPLTAVRKRNCYLAAKSCTKALSKNATTFNLIHAHFLENGFIGASLKSSYDKPLVVTAHGGDVYDLPFRDSWYNNLARYVLSESDKVITVSHFLAEKLSELGVSSKKLHVVPNGYDENLFKPLPSNAMRKKLGLPLNKRILLSVGDLVDVKGHTYLIDAMNIVLKKKNDVILVIIGSGPLKERLQKKVNKLGLNGKILLVGRKTHDEIPMWMNASDIFVLPSLGEGFPTVVPEAMACGKPVIATCVGGVPEAIVSSELGTLVAPKGPKVLSQAILEGLSRDWLQEKILDEAKRYSWNIIVKQIIAVYERVAE